MLTALCSPLTLAEQDFHVLVLVFSSSLYSGYIRNDLLIEQHLNLIHLTSFMHAHKNNVGVF